jgi:hypothetical protein
MYWNLVEFLFHHLWVHIMLERQASGHSHTSFSWCGWELSDTIRVQVWTIILENYF